MIKNQKLPENILRLMAEARNYLESHPKILFAYLFGGLAKGEPQPLSDVDIAVFLTGTPVAVEDKLDILGKLINSLQTDEIDLVILNTAGLPLIMNILRSKRVLVDKQPLSRHIFESLMMRKYFDFSIKESAMLKRRYLNG